MNHTPENTTPIAFVDVNVVPMDSERILSGQTVIVRGDRISEIGPVHAIDVPEGAQRIDGRDKYLMPGLVDMHVHLEYDQLILFITNGVTTIRNMLGREDHLKLRAEIKASELIGPTIYTTGLIIDGNPPRCMVFAVVETPQQAAQVVAEHKKAGYDFIKVYSSLSLEVYDALVEAAAKHGMPVVGHVPSAVGIEHVLEAGQHTVEHLSGYWRYLKAENPSSWQSIDETKLPHIMQATYEVGTWNCVTLVRYQRGHMNHEELRQELKLPHMKYIPLRWKQMFELLHRDRYSRQYVRDVMCNRKKVTKALHDAGAKVLLGTDTPNNPNPYIVAGFSIHQELRNLVDAGLTPYEAIRAGTRDAAECLGDLDEFGTVTVGLRADLLLVDGNPLVDVVNAGKRIGIMLRGHWLPQPELQSMLDTLAAKYAAEENPDGVMLRGRWYTRPELEAMVDAQYERKKEEFVKGILSSDRIFLSGNGNNEPAARSAAAKLMQSRPKVYFTGDETAPAVGKEDALIAISHSRFSVATYNIAASAKNSGACVFLFICLIDDLNAPIADISDLVFVLGPVSRAEFDKTIHMLVDRAVALITEGQK